LLKYFLCSTSIATLDFSLPSLIRGGNFATLRKQQKKPPVSGGFFVEKI